MKPTNSSACKRVTLIVGIVFLVICKAKAQSLSAQFTATNISGCSPLIVTFQDLSTGGATTWNWNFGNGNTSSLQHPTATYFTPGTYNVTLTVSNANGSNSITRNEYVTVYGTPAVNFAASTTSGCFPLHVQFSDISLAGPGTNNVSWLWDFGNGITSTQQHPSITFNTVGDFPVTLKVTNDKGCTKTITRPSYIHVTSGVKSLFTNSSPTVCHAPAAISFTNSASGPGVLSYYWDFGDGNTSTQKDPSHTFSSDGTYIVKLTTYSNAGCEDTYQLPVTIGNIITSFNAPPTVCVGQPFELVNTSNPAPVSSVWKFDDGFTAAFPSMGHTFFTPGVQTVKLVNTYASCVDSTTRLISVMPNPVAAFAATDSFSCDAPFTTQFNDMSTGGIVGWLWEFGDGNTSTLQNPQHTFQALGAYTVKLTVTNAAGCTSTFTRPNYIVLKRTTISMNGLPQEGCLPYTISPTANISSLVPISGYQWDFGDGNTSNVANPSHTYTVQGTYNIRLIVTTITGCSDTIKINQAVKVGNKPNVDFVANPVVSCASGPITFTDLSTVADHWLWYFGNGDSSLVQNPTIAYGAVGFFTVKLIATNNGCRDTAIKVRYIQTYPPVANWYMKPDCINRKRFEFFDLSTQPLTWAWDFGDGSPIDHTPNPSHEFPGYGVYYVKLTVTNGTCSDTRMYPVHTINEDPDFTTPVTEACKVAGLNFQVTNSNVSNFGKYIWQFGNATTLDTVFTPAVWKTFTNSGTYDVVLVTQDLNGCRDTVIKRNYIRINGPIANFDAVDVAGCKGFTTTFNDHSSNDGVSPITQWTFDFGDGNRQSFSSAPFQHIYSNAGTYSVKLITTDAGGCSDSLVLTDIIHATDPLPDFTADTLSCPGGTITFTNSSAPANMSYRWTFGDGNTSTLISPTHAYSVPGDYAVRLWVKDEYGCADSIMRENYIHIKKPVAAFTVNDSLSSCSPFKVSFTNTSSFYTSSYWSFGQGQGNSDLDSPIHYYSTPGTYQAQLKVTSLGGCVDSVYHTIKVSDTIGSRMNYLPAEGCKPLQLQLSAFTSGQMANYYWDYGDGYTESTSSPDVNHIYRSYGNFLPKVIMKDPSGCLIPLEGLDTIYVTGATAKFGLNQVLLCDQGTINFTDSTTFNDPIAHYSWNFGDGVTSTLQHPSHHYTAAGDYSVQLAVETAIGCRDTITRPALVKVVNSPRTAIAGDTSVCIGGSLLHRGVSLTDLNGVLSWQWKLVNGNTSNAQQPPVQKYPVAGDYVLTSVATNNYGCKDTTMQHIHVHALPVIKMPAQLTVQSGTTFTMPVSYSSNVKTWLWTPGKELSCTKCPKPEATPTFATNYQVYVTDSNGCANTASLLVNTACSNSNVFIPNTFSPNGDGSNDVLYPRGKGLSRIKSFRIFNRWGQVVFERRDFAANDPSSGWDGRFNNKEPFADVYIYQLEYFCDNGELLQLNGNVTLIR